MKIRDYFALLRVHQYIKNIFIFAPLFFTFNFERDSAVRCLIAFVCFSCIASAVYIFNDYQDRANDALHPTKRNRPLASGKISPFWALCIACTLVLLGGSGILELGWGFFTLCLIYLLLNLSYSLKLKHIALFDVCIVAVGFILRLLIGADAGGVELSHWIIITTFFLSLFLAFCKRRDDVRLLEAEGIRSRKSIEGYSLGLIDFCISISATMSILSYVMWSISPSSILKLHSPYLYLTSIFVILGIMRYAQIVYVEFGGGSPTWIVLKDRFMHSVLLGWILSFVAIWLGN